MRHTKATHSERCICVFDEPEQIHIDVMCIAGKQMKCANIRSNSFAFNMQNSLTCARAFKLLTNNRLLYTHTQRFHMLFAHAVIYAVYWR